MLFDYETLKLIWWVVIGFVLILYATTAGADFGVTLMMPFLKRKAKFTDNDKERRVILNTIAPVWDGNQTWIVFAGGALFVIWPAVYAATFSGLYALMLFILWSFFLRPPGFDYRGKIHSPAWRTAWDWGLFVSAFFPVLMFGLAIGNLFVGLPNGYDPVMMRSIYAGNFFGLFNVFGVVCALASLFMCLMHGAAHLNRRLSGDLQVYFRKLHAWFSLTFLVLLTLGGILLATKVSGYSLMSQATHPTEQPFAQHVVVSMGGWYHSMQAHAWKWIPVIVAYLGVLIALLTARWGKGHFSFWSSCIGVGGTVALFGSTLFPFTVPSSYNPAQSLTIWNAVSAPYTLNAMLYLGAVMLVIIFIYKFMGFHSVWRAQGKLSTQDVEKNEHVFY